MPGPGAWRAQRRTAGEELIEQLKELVVGQRQSSGSELVLDVSRCMAGLARLGCTAGDRIAVLLRNCQEQLVVTSAAQQMGAYPVQLNWHSQPPELHYVLEDCGARVVVAHADLICKLDRAKMAGVELISVRPSSELIGAYRVDSAAAEPLASDLEWGAWIAPMPASTVGQGTAVESVIYTSGTTGNPKGVHRFRATAVQLERTERMRLTMTGIGWGSRVLVPAPLYHTAPHMFAMRAIRKAEALVVMVRFDPVELLRTIETYRITHLYVVPTMFVRLLALDPLLRQRFDLSSLQFALHAGGPCAPTLKRAMIDWWGPVINEYYGSTEGGPLTFCTSQDALARPGTIGRALDGVHIEVQDEEGRTLAPNQIGELFARNDGYADFTYLNRPLDRAAIQRGELMATGDIGYRDSDGYWFLCDRKRDMVISGGVNVYPAEVEAAVLELPQIADCAVFGIPDDEFGEALAAYIQPLAGQDVDSELVIAHLRDRIAAFKIPRVVEVRSELPRDEAGKIRKRLLRDPHWARAGRQI